MSQSKPKYVLSRPQPTVRDSAEESGSARTTSGLFSNPIVGDVIGPVNLDEWQAADGELSLTSDAERATLFDIISGVLFQHHLLGDSPEEPPAEATSKLAINQALWHNVAIEFEPKRPITLAQLADNPNQWPARCGFVNYTRGRHANIVGAVLRQADGTLEQFEEKPFEIAGIVRTIIGSSDLRDSSFAKLGYLSQSWAEVYTQMRFEADTHEVNQTLTPIASSVIAVPAIGLLTRTQLARQGFDVSRLPDKAVSIANEATWNALGEAVIATTPPGEDPFITMASVPVYALDSSKYKVAQYQPK